MGYSSENSIRSLNVPAKTKKEPIRTDNGVAKNTEKERKKKGRMKERHGQRNVSSNGWEETIKHESALFLI